MTVEPILDFDPEVLAGWIEGINPDFLNIGADSKQSHLPEPTPEKVRDFIGMLQLGRGVEMREKRNLARLMGA